MVGVEIGDLVGPVGTVDRKGTLECGPWAVEWGIGAEDRWHRASAEAAVRQALLDDSPVAVTAMRVPGGDIVHRAAGVNDGTGRAVSIEIENRSGTPVSLALVVVMSDGIGGGDVTVSERCISVDGRDALVLDRPAGGTVATDADYVWEAVTAGPASGDRHFASRSGSAAGAVAVPLPHHQTVYLSIPVSGPPPDPVPAGAIAAGWRAIADRAATVEVGDPATVARWRQEVPAVVLAAGSADVERAARAARSLDRVGLPDEADRARAPLVAAVEQGRVAGPAAAAVAMALASRRLLTGRESGLPELVALLVGSGLTAEQIDYVASALDREDARIASDVRGLRPVTVADELEPTGLEALIDAMVTDSEPGVDLLPQPDPRWLGGPVDVRDLVTRHGAVSYSVRWHGDRPALLWQVASDGPILLTATGLDPAWSAAEPEGEALLSSVR